MRFGEKDITIEPLDPKRTVALVQFFVEVWQAVDEASQRSLADGALQGRWLTFVETLEPSHLIKLTSILTGLSQSEVSKHWTLEKFVEVLADLSEVENLPALVKNLQRVAASYRA